MAGVLHHCFDVTQVENFMALSLSLFSETVISVLLSLDGFTPYWLPDKSWSNQKRVPLDRRPRVADQELLSSNIAFYGLI